MSEAAAEAREISVVLPDGARRAYPAGTIAAEVAADISPSLSRAALAARVDGALVDLSRPLERDAAVEIVTARDPEAVDLFRHDLAHIMARAVQELWPETDVTIGPVVENGWYYDFDRAEPFSEDDLGKIEVQMRRIIAARDPVRAEVWPRARAIAHYEETGQPFKKELVEAIPEGEPIRMYWHGHWQDLCRGPHLAHTGQAPADAFKLMRVAGAYWRGDAKNKQLQRIYGVGFRTRAELEAHLKMLEEAARRDHRRIGREMNLFQFEEEAPGMVYWRPDGWTLYRTVENYVRRRIEAADYREIRTPQVVDRRLWEASGHWDKYRENMFVTEIAEEHANEKRVNALKPMNCPCHVQVFNQGLKSYRDLPLRLAEFGSCHRYESSGSLHGLMRVRGFIQDDAHIFCTEDQIESETAKFIELLGSIYRDFGFDGFQIMFSTRPAQRVGSDEVWDRAEAALESAVRKVTNDYVVDPGEGAFYGPKLDFKLTDAIGRVWQCGTWQCDFTLPERLGAEYVAQDGSKRRPVMMHRAILGSIERFIGVLIENCAGRFPMWLAPRQAVVAAIVSDADDYAREVSARLKAAGLRAELDLRNEKINYKVREHSAAHVPAILAVGRREVESGEVALRRLGAQGQRALPLDQAVATLAAEAAPPDLAAA